MVTFHISIYIYGPFQYLLLFDISIYGHFNICYYLQLLHCLCLAPRLLVHCEHPSVLSPADICLGKVQLFADHFLAKEQHLKMEQKTDASLHIWRHNLTIKYMIHNPGLYFCECFLSVFIQPSLTMMTRAAKLLTSF